MTTEPGAKPRRNTALIVSLCVNFFLIGVLVAGALGAIHRFHAFRGGDRDGFDPRAVMHMLPDARRDELEPLLHGKRDQIKPLIEATRDAREEAYRVFKQENFDAAAFDAAMTKVREADDALALATQAIIAEVAAKLTAEERGRVARSLLERRWHDDRRGDRHRGRFGRDRGDDDSPPPENDAAPPAPDGQ